MGEQVVMSGQQGVAGMQPPSGGNGAGEPPAGAGGGNGTGGASGDGGAPAWQPPEFVPEHMRAATPEETLQNVWKAYEGYQKAHKSAGPVPETPDAYEFDLPDELKQAGVELKDDDPALKIWREAAHAAGLGQEQFRRAIPAFLQKAQEAGLLMPPIDVQAELNALGKEAGGVTPEEIAQAGKERLAKAVDFVDGLAARGVLDEAEAEAMKELAVDAAGVKAIEKIMGLVQSAESAVPGAAPGSAPGVMTQDDVDRLMRDPRYDTRSPKHDPKWRAEADRKINAFYARQQQG